ncbi:MAG: hypothetical protein GWO76_02845 [Proteobacteria bacterium]|nr:hypothetical protein [Pseudomonadota bacterium]
MKNKHISLLILLAACGLAFISNPSEADHRSYRKSLMGTNILEQLIGSALNYQMTYSDYGLFSVASNDLKAEDALIQLDDVDPLVTVGVFGRVIVLSGPEGSNQE